MGRKREKQSQQLPKYVYLSKGRYVYKPYLGQGQFGKEVVLAKDTDPLSKVYTKYEKLKELKTYTLEWLLQQYLKGETIKERSTKTQSEYHRYANCLIKTKLADGKIFGAVEIRVITPKVIRRYLDNQIAKVSANRHIQFLKAVFNWGKERYDAVQNNPCLGVRLHTEKPRTRYIEDWEFELVKNFAQPTYIALFMEFAYLFRARWSEIASMEQGAVKENGVLLLRGKGSENELTLWSPRLREAISTAKRYNNNVLSRYLIHNKDGTAIRKNAFDSSWQRLMEKAMRQGLNEKFTFHDIKAKGVSDHQDKYGGHKSEKMKKVYDRKLNEVVSTR